MIQGQAIDNTIRRSSYVGLCLLICLWGAIALHADEVTLDNGQKMIGRITKSDDLDLYLSVHFADASIPIRWKNIVALQTSSPVRVQLRDGRSFFANIQLREDGSITLQEDGVPVPVQTTRSDLYYLEERKGALDGEVGLSGTGSAGNSKTLSVRLYWDLYFRWKTQSLQFKGDSSLDSSDGVTTDRNVYAQVRYDYLFGDPAFLFGSLEENNDRFADIESRTIATVGVGTFIANTQEFVLKADIGFTYTISRLEVGGDSDTPGYRPSIFLLWKLPLDLRVKDTVTFYGNFDQSSDWQARNELLISREVFKGFHLNGGLTSTWDHGAAPGFKQRDDTYFFGIGYEF